jgi:hypothetical protein
MGLESIVFKPLPVQGFLAVREDVHLKGARFSVVAIE